MTIEEIKAGCKSERTRDAVDRAAAVLSRYARTGVSQKVTVLLKQARCGRPTLLAVAEALGVERVIAPYGEESGL